MPLPITNVDIPQYPGQLSQLINGLTIGISYLLTCDFALAQQSGFVGDNYDNYWPTVAGSAAPAALIVLGTLWGFFIHANLRWRFGPLEWFVTTPAFHHWHHSRHEHINRNYASTLPFLDRLFGSYYLPRHWPAEVGRTRRSRPL